MNVPLAAHRPRRNRPCTCRTHCQSRAQRLRLPFLFKFWFCCFGFGSVRVFSFGFEERKKRAGLFGRRPVRFFLCLCLWKKKGERERDRFLYSHRHVHRLAMRHAAAISGACQRQEKSNGIAMRALIATNCGGNSWLFQHMRWAEFRIALLKSTK